MSGRKTVIFRDIQDTYDYNEDLICRYELDGYTPVEGDRIAIYKSGWSFVKDYFLFEWIPNFLDNNIKHVTFNKICLPRDDNELYQFCYVSAENEVLGASKAFQFVDSSVSSKKSESMSLTTDSIYISKEILKLREENEILKESLKLFMAQKAARNYDREIMELKTMIYTLKDVVERQRAQVDCLTKKLDKLCLNDEVVQRIITHSGIREPDLELEPIPPIPKLMFHCDNLFEK